jgi:AmmeMemoRadiSam system protein B
MDGQQWVCLRDPQSFAHQPVFLTGMSVFVASRLDGGNSLLDIQADYMRATGNILPMSQIRELVQQLDEHFYLDSQRFHEFREGLIRAFVEAAVRPALHAGSAYEADRTALRRQIESYFAHPEGPGAARPAERTAHGLIAPHIDFRRGGPTYAHSYAALSGDPADRYIVFGTCHTSMQKRFSLTLKDYDTPLGLLRNDREFMARMTGKLQQNYFCDEFSHRGEHSIEFQAVCLQYLFPENADIRIVPILVGSFQDIYSTGRTPSDEPGIEELVHAVTSTCSELPGRTCIIAGADLAHVGRRFGDSYGPTEASLREVERDDRTLLKLVEDGDAEGVFRCIASDNDRRNVCGYPPIYMLLRCLAGARGRLLQYRQWADLQSGAAVTYAGVAMY